MLGVCNLSLRTHCQTEFHSNILLVNILEAYICLSFIFRATEGPEMTFIYCVLGVEFHFVCVMNIGLIYYYFV